MAGILTVDAIQVGDGLAANNLVIKTNDDGSFVIARGNVGGALTPILSIDADGKVVPEWEKAVGNQSLAGSGYQKLANGLILQWGGGTHQVAGASINFPISFPNTLFSISVTPISTAPNTNNVSFSNSSLSGYTGYSGNNATGVNYIAIGR